MHGAQSTARVAHGHCVIGDKQHIYLAGQSLVNRCFFSLRRTAQSDHLRQRCRQSPGSVDHAHRKPGDTGLAACAGNHHRISQDSARPRPRCNNCWKAWTSLCKVVAAQDVAQVKLVVAIFIWLKIYPMMIQRSLNSLNSTYVLHSRNPSGYSVIRAAQPAVHAVSGGELRLPGHCIKSR